MNPHLLRTLALVVAPMLAVALLPDDLPLLGVPHAAAIGLAVGGVVFLLTRGRGEGGER